MEILACFNGQAARHINVVGDDYLLSVNAEYAVEIYQRGVEEKLKTLDISYMRASKQIGDLLFIGTEEKMLYLIDV